DEVADLVGRELGAGQHRQHAGHGGGRLGVDRLDARMRVRRAQELNESLARPADVVGVLALAGDETEVFLAAHRRADAGRAHGALLPWNVTPTSMIPKKPAPDLIRGGPRFSEKIMLQRKTAALFGGLGTRIARHRLGAGGDRLDDIVIAGAAAQVALELLADGAVVEVVAL